MTEPRDNTEQAAAEIQAATTQGWASDMAQNRCAAATTVSTPLGDAPVRCEAQAGHVGELHTGHVDGHAVRWTVPSASGRG